MPGESTGRAGTSRSQYNPLDSTPSPTRPSFASIRRPSLSSLRFGSSRSVHTQRRLPDPDEMDAAFDGPDGDDEEDGDERDGLLRQPQPKRQNSQPIPGEYDFERDYTQPPPSPPPFQPYSHHNPAPGNTNGIIPSHPTSLPTPQPPRHFLGGILPTSILPRQNSPRVVGATNAGVFSNLSARPDNTQPADGDNYVPETEQKEGPPSYQAALRDAVPPYWDTTVVLPSSSSPFGPLSSSISGDEILIDGMPSGNLFSFAWNVIVSVSFQFVGFLLTYVLHTTHAAKYGSRVGLGMTLIQFGFSLRSRAEQLIETGRFPTDPDDPAPDPGTNPDEIEADNALKAFMGGLPWPQSVHDPLLGPESAPVVIHNTHEAELFAEQHNMTLAQMLNLPSAADVGRANEYFSFLLMTIGWFLVLTSLGGWWRVKRFERGLRRAQRESEQAQAEANGTAPPNETTTAEGNTAASGVVLGPRDMAYYTQTFTQTWRGVNELRRGFFGMNGRPVRGNGHTPLPQNDEDVELFDAAGFGLEPMAQSGAGTDEAGRRSRSRGLWGV